MKLVGFALFLGIFFNLIYDVLKYYGMTNPEWFWYVGIATQTLILFIIIRRIYGRNPITNMGVYIGVGVLVKEIFGNPILINFIEYPIIVGAFLVELYLYKKNDRN